MVFYSLKFLILLPLLFLLHHYAAPKCRRYLLLAASILFYASFGHLYLLFALSAVVAVSYAAGIAIGRASTERLKKRVYILGVAGNLATLVAIKYIPTLHNMLQGILSALPVHGQLPQPPLLVSIGVSYFVFQAISYLTDILLGIVEPESDPVDFSLYISFFPKLLQGPIERAADLLPQLKLPYLFQYENVRGALLLFVWGMCKKLVIADRIALYVDMTYFDLSGSSGWALLMATWLYAFQLYFDFSGYTDMAIAIARLFNINLTQNFNSPYLATTVSEFWRRWHISFSRWILDYIFKPLQMLLRYHGNYGTAAALLVTFFISGIWHGATGGFVVWGVLHGVYLASSVFYKPLQKKIHKRTGLHGTLLLRCWQIFITFNLLSFSWIFFRAATLADALKIVSKIGESLLLLITTADFGSFFTIGIGKSRLLQSLLPLLVPLLVALFRRKGDLFSWPRWLRWIVYYILVYSIIYASVINSKAQFVYFQF